MPESKELSIVIPIYNEGNFILKTLKEIEKKVIIPYEVVLVYDTEEDTSLPYLRDSSFKHIRLVKNLWGRGVLTAIKTGFKKAKTSVVVIFMADLADDPAVINTMFAKLNEGYDLVCGSRYMKGGGQIGGPFIKAFLSRIAGVSIKVFLKIPTSDSTNAFKMYRKKVINSISIESTGGFEYSLELTIKAFIAGLKIAEVPTVWRDRTEGNSKFRLWHWLPKYLQWYLYGLRHRYKIH